MVHLPSKDYQNSELRTQNSELRTKNSENYLYHSRTEEHMQKSSCYPDTECLHMSMHIWNIAWIVISALIKARYAKCVCVCVCMCVCMCVCVCLCILIDITCYSKTDNLNNSTTQYSSPRNHIYYLPISWAYSNRLYYWHCQYNSPDHHKGITIV